MKDIDIVQEWLYEEGKKPFSIQPETHLFDLIIVVTEGDEPYNIVSTLKDAGMPKEAIGRFMDYFIAKAIKENKLRQIIFIED